MAKNGLKKKMTGDGQMVQVKKKGKEVNLRVLVYPAEGGAPYYVDVQPDGDLFTLPDSDFTYKITRGSVSIEDGRPRTVVNEGNPQTINIHSLTGDDSLHPKVLHGIAYNNFIEQDSEYNRRQPFWRQGATWGLFLGLGLVILMMFWMTRTIGGGFEELSQAIQLMMQESANQGGGGGAAANAGHNRIAPGGQ